jgi:hypothetical protein
MPTTSLSPTQSMTIWYTLSTRDICSPWLATNLALWKHSTECQYTSSASCIVSSTCRSNPSIVSVVPSVYHCMTIGTQNIVIKARCRPWTEPCSNANPHHSDVIQTQSSATEDMAVTFSTPSEYQDHGWSGSPPDYPVVHASRSAQAEEERQRLQSICGEGMNEVNEGPGRIEWRTSIRALMLR